MYVYIKKIKYFGIKNINTYWNKEKKNQIYTLGMSSTCGDVGW